MPSADDISVGVGCLMILAALILAPIWWRAFWRKK